MAMIELSSLADTAMLGNWLAGHILVYGNPAILMSGELGAGKTTLISQIVRQLPGAEQAEISSPSFNIYNIYPTTPPVLHGDLYRCQNRLPEEIFEIMEEDRAIILLEWGEYLNPEYITREYMDISFKKINNARLLTCRGYGTKAAAMTLEMEKYMKKAPISGPAHILSDTDSK